MIFNCVNCNTIVEAEEGSISHKIESCFDCWYKQGLSPYMKKELGNLNEPR